jgi:hypothetical protein
MLTGSFAAAVHGSMRATQDIDLVIETDERQLRDLVRALPEEEYYADLDAAIDALEHESQFNVIDLATGWKVDLIIRKERPFSIGEFARRGPVDLDGVRLRVASAEDTVIAKLEWASIGGSARQLEDVAAILRIRRAALDLAYIERWVSELGLASEWARAKELSTDGHD